MVVLVTVCRDRGGFVGGDFLVVGVGISGWSPSESRCLWRGIGVVCDVIGSEWSGEGVGG